MVQNFALPLTGFLTLDKLLNIFCLSFLMCSMRIIVPTLLGYCDNKIKILKCSGQGLACGTTTTAAWWLF